MSRNTTKGKHVELSSKRGESAAVVMGLMAANLSALVLLLSLSYIYAHSDRPKDKLLGGLLSSGFNEPSCLSRYQSTLYRKLSPHRPSPDLISKLRNYEALHKRCGPHTESYNTALNHLNHSHPHTHPDISNNDTCKYVVHLSLGRSGMGNRMLSLVSSFLYAVLTNRVLLIDQDHDMDALLCEPFPDTTWVLPLDFPLRNQFERFDPTHSHCYGNMMKSRTVEESPPPFVYLNLVRGYNEYDKRFFCNQDQDIMEKVPWLVLRSNQYFIPSLFLILSFEKEASKLFPEKQTVFHHLGRYLLHPSNQVWGMITGYYEAYLAKADERIGIQVRDFKSTGLPFQSSKDHIAKYYLPHLALNETILLHDLSMPFAYMMDRILDCSVKGNLLPKVMTNTQESVCKAKKNPKTKAVLVTSLNSSYSEELRNMYYLPHLALNETILLHDFKSTGLPFQSSKDHIAKHYRPHLALNETILLHDLSMPFAYMMDRILDCSVKGNLLPKVITNTQESVRKAKKNPKTKAVLVTSLNSSYSEELRNMYPENPNVMGESISVFQPSHEEFQQSQNGQHNMKALAEIYLLSLMDELITSPWSTFGYVAQGLGGLRPWILSNPQRKMDSDSPCHQAISMEPCFHFPPFYDCEAKTEVDTGERVPYVRHCEDTSWGIKLFDDHQL